MAQSGLQLSGVPHFLGVNLRRDRLSLADEEVARAINADLHTQIGTVMLRLGRSKQFTSALSSTTIRRIAKVNGARYQVAGTTVFRNQTSILTGLSSDEITTIIPFRPLNDDTTWAFIADSELMRKDNGSAVRNWGITAPTAAMTAAVGAAGSLTGTYGFVYTYARVVDGAVAHESNPSPAATVALTADVADLSVIAASSDAQVTHKRIYRTQAGGTVYLFDQMIANATTTATSSQVDTGLGGAVEEDNDPPQNAPWAVEFQNHIFLCRYFPDYHALLWSKRNRPESFPPDNILYIGNPDDLLECGVKLAGLLGVFTRLTKYRVTGTSTTGFVAGEALTRRGTAAINAVIATEFGAIFPARDGVFLTNFVSPDQELSQDIEPIFFGETVNEYTPINWTYARSFSAAVYKQRYYLSYVSGHATAPNMVAVFSQDTRKWYFYSHPLGSLFVEEDMDDLVGGGLDGFCYVLEDGATDAGSDISLEVQTKEVAGVSPYVKKLFFYLRVDCDTMGDDLTVKLYIDGALKSTTTVNNRRTRPVIRLPEGCMGYQWQVVFTYSGSNRIKIYGVQAFHLPLEVAA